MRARLPRRRRGDLSEAVTRRLDMVRELRRGSHLPDLHPADFLRTQARVSARLDGAAIASLASVEASGSSPLGARSPGLMLTVFGAKGGIGKSTIATNVAAAIARKTDLSVLLVDLDTRFGDVAIMMDLEPRFSVAELAANVDALDRSLFLSALVRHLSGVHVLSAPKHPSQWADITAAQMAAIVRFGATLFDYVIVDTPGTFNDLVATAIDATDRVLLVSSLDMARVKDTSYVLDRLEADRFPPERLLLTINQVNRARNTRVADVPDVVRHPVFWAIRYDEEVVHSTQAGRPVVISQPKARAARELLGLSQKVTGLDTAAVWAQEPSGLRRWLPPLLVRALSAGGRGLSRGAVEDLSRAPAPARTVAIR